MSFTRQHNELHGYNHSLPQECLYEGANLMDKYIIFRQVSMHQVASLIHLPQEQDQLRVEGLLLLLRDVCILQAPQMLGHTPQASTSPSISQPHPRHTEL